MRDRDEDEQQENRGKGKQGNKEPRPKRPKGVLNARVDQMLREEQAKSLQPHNHAYSREKFADGEACFWCKGSLSQHSNAVDCSSGVRRVI